ncbi:MAG: DUF1016 N-terminal domain-containing protein, partial [Methanolobus sp.]|nr:DUF1016 N-terminal domain-containing protein [Methanolobus sp.]
MNSSDAPDFNFSTLVKAIQRVHENCAVQASKAVNIGLTLRNWSIGFYICEYEQKGSDRAFYGEKLLEQLADKLHQQGMVRSEERELRRYRQFYLTYPQ